MIATSIIKHVFLNITSEVHTYDAQSILIVVNLKKVVITIPQCSPNKHSITITIALFNN